MVDTAAQVTMINPKLLAQLKVMPILDKHIKINNVQKGSDMMRQVARGVDLRLGDDNYDWDIVIAPMSVKCILGHEFLKSHHCYLNLEDKSMRVDFFIPATLIRNSGIEYAINQVVVDKKN